MTNRRAFITLLGGAAAWPLAARAQQSERMRRIGVINAINVDDPEWQTRLAAFHQGLQEAGWIVGRNVRIDYRLGTGDTEVIRRRATELVALAPDVILASGGAVVGTLLQVTRTVPIVFTQTPDPVGAGFVNSLAQPGGNATGFTSIEYGVNAKYPELLREIAPRVTRAAVLRDPTIPQGIGQFAVIQSVGPSLGMELTPGQCERRRRDRANRHRICALVERRSGGAGERVGVSSSRSDYRAGGATQTARDLLRALLRHRRRPALVRC
jgi:putative ABC transport system substrate-binding protein